MFDATISSGVSLFKILDAFIVEGESADLIVQFLQQHDSCFSDIIGHSLYGDRLFQLDFFLKCHGTSQQYLINKLKDTSIDVASYLAWQILQSDSKIAQSAKYALRRELNWILKHGLRHPYAGKHETYVSPLDNACFRLAKADRIAELPVLSDKGNFTQYFKYIYYSLFRNRLIQCDFFGNLNEAQKCQFLFDVFMYAPRALIGTTLKKFTMQVLDSSERTDVKAKCLENFLHIAGEQDILDQKNLEVIKTCGSFSEFMLKMSIVNTELGPDIILYLLATKRHKQWLKEWLDYDRPGLLRILNLADLLESKL